MLALAIVAGACLYFIGGGDGHRYVFHFQNAGQLVPDNQVQIGGHPVGSVEDIRLSDDGLAEIEVSMEQELHEGSTAVIRATGLAGVANHYVSISPGPNSEPALPDGATIGLTNTTTSVDLDQVFNAFTPRTREALRDFVRGNAAIYEGRAREANKTYKFFEPALAQTRRVLAELNADKRMFERFLVGSSKLFGALGDRAEDLESSVTSANAALSAIAGESESVTRSLDALPQAFRQSNTTFVNLRAALDDLDSLVATAKPATKDLASFLARTQPVIRDSVPVFRNLRRAVAETGPANDLNELTAVLPELRKRADSSFDQAADAIADFQPTLEFARAYSPDMVNALAKLGQVTANFDASGHYVRVKPVSMNFLRSNGGLLEALGIGDQYAPFGAERIATRCPGGAIQQAADNSNPFVAPLWPGSGLDATDCDPSEVPGP